MRYYWMILLISIFSNLKAQESLNLYKGEIPNAIRIDSAKYNRNIPSLFVYKPSKSIDKNIGILIIPGGGYAHIAMDHEGHDVAKELNKAGFTTFVLKYRLPSPNIMKDKSIGPLQDAQRAIQLIRTEFASLKKVGIVGFSAGGHLASTLITKSDQAFIDNDSHISLAPDFAGLIYPVISMDDAVTHKGSKLNLLGENASSEKVLEFSSDKNPNKSIGPVYFVHAEDDKSVPIENTYLMKAALDKVGVKTDLLTFKNGGHGFGLINKTSPVKWLDQFVVWVDNLK